MSEFEEWIAVQVPKNIAPDVYAFVAERMAKGSPPAAAAPPAREELVILMYEESQSAMRNFLRLLAGRAGEDVSSATICQELQLAPGQGLEVARQKLAGVLGAFGRRVKNRYKGAQKPFSARFDRGKNMWVYRMEPKVAQVIQQAAKAAEK